MSASDYTEEVRTGSARLDEGPKLNSWSLQAAHDTAPHPATGGGAAAGPSSSADSHRDTDFATPLDLVRFCLDDMKAEEIVEIDLAGKTSIADTMLIATGRSNRHVGAIAERIIGAFKDHGFGTVKVEGMPACDWVLIDAGDLMVHLFRPEVRAFYNLEKMWGADRPRERAAG